MAYEVNPENVKKAYVLARFRKRAKT